VCVCVYMYAHSACACLCACMWHKKDSFNFTGLVDAVCVMTGP